MDLWVLYVVKISFFPLENSSDIFIPDLNVLEVWILFPLKFVDIELDWQSGYCDREYVLVFSKTWFLQL